jgi:hypothetical protein
MEGSSRCSAVANACSYALKTTTTRRAHVGKVRWQLVALHLVAAIINYFDREALSVTALLITEELGLDSA